ncbi:MAG: hypothetical protein GX413_13095 [Acetobacter sp.]|nr:hypothetical protein [Acetobacter sp.]
MSKVSAFSVLDEMCTRDPKGEHIVSFMSPDNFLEAKTGKDGWGFVKMAVNNDTIIRLMHKPSVKLVLLVYDVANFKEIKNDMEIK